MFYARVLGTSHAMSRRNNKGLIGSVSIIPLQKHELSNRGRRPRLYILSLWLLALCGLMAIHTLTRSPVDIYSEESDVSSPYERLRGGERSAKWILSHAHRVQDKLTTSLMQKLGQQNQAQASGYSLPHSRLETIGFQEEMYKLTALDWEEYQGILTEFAQHSLTKKIKDWAISSLRYRGRPRLGGEKIPPQIWQTGKELTQADPTFVNMNRDANYNFMDDTLIESWTKHHFNGTLIYDTWNNMERIVLKADLWRYLVMFIEGGFYSDTDTTCLKPVDSWGTIDAVVWHLDDPIAQRAAKGPPLIIVGIEVDTPDITGWEQFWTRPIQIVQWSFASQSGHPIFLDSIRRVTQSMSTISSWQDERRLQASKLLDNILKPTRLQDRRKAMKDLHIWDQLKLLLLTDPFDKDNGGSMSLIEATGPGAFSDAVFSYLWARYGIHWSQLHDIQTTTRIGEIAIVPITGFAPFERPDWKRWKGIKTGPMSTVGDVTHTQALVNHHFSGSWRTAHDEVI